MVFFMERNNILHFRAVNGIRGPNNVALQTFVSQQYSIGYEGLEEEDFYLLENSKDKLMKEPVEMFRGWLWEIIIAREDLASDQLESLRDKRRRHMLCLFWWRQRKEVIYVGKSVFEKIKLVAQTKFYMGDLNLSLL